MLTDSVTLGDWHGPGERTRTRRYARPLHSGARVTKTRRSWCYGGETARLANDGMTYPVETAPGLDMVQARLVYELGESLIR
jgi:hypothetical protein